MSEMLTTSSESKKTANVMYSYRGGLLLSFFLILLLMHPSFAADPDLGPKNETELTVAGWADDPFASRGGAWLSLDGYEQKKVDDRIAAEKAAEEARQKMIAAEKVSERVRAMAIPVMSSPSAIRAEQLLPNVDFTLVDQFSIETERSWMTVQDAEEELELVKKAQRLQHEFAEGRFKIRLTTLPDTSIQVSREDAAAKKKKKEEKKIAAALRQKQLEKEFALKAEKEKAACKAVSDYRKRQLDALESDRQTLAALQEALAGLGLKEKLSFMDKTNDQSLTVGSLGEGQEAPTKP